MSFVPVWSPEDVWFKDPEDVASYTFDWSPFLASGETISSSSMNCDSLLTNVSETHTDTTSSIKVSNGVNCTQSLITMQIVTSASNTYNAQKFIYIRNRWD